MCAMLEIERNNRLKELGWTLLLQVYMLVSFCSTGGFSPVQFSFDAEK
jgi:hypothetical protein